MSSFQKCPMMFFFSSAIIFWVPTFLFFFGLVALSFLYFPLTLLQSFVGFPSFAREYHERPSHASAWRCLTRSPPPGFAPAKRSWFASSTTCHSEPLFSCSSPWGRTLSYTWNHIVFFGFLLGFRSCCSREWLLMPLRCLEGPPESLWSGEDTTHCGREL